MNSKTWMAIGFSTLMVLSIISGAVLSAPAGPVIEDYDIPEKAYIGEPIPVSINLTNGFEIYKDYYDKVWIWYKINDYDEPDSFPLQFNEETGYWAGNVTLPSQYNYTLEVTWLYVQVYTENTDTFQNVKTLVVAPEQEGSPWELVLIVVFLGLTFVIIELSFKPMRRRPRRGEQDDDRENDEPDSE